MTDRPWSLSMPLRIERGRAVVVEQGSPTDIAQCVEVAARTVVGDRLEAPEFGIPPLVMATAEAIDVDELRAHLVESEPRCEPIIDRIETLDDVRAELIEIWLLEEGED